VSIFLNRSGESLNLFEKVSQISAESQGIAGVETKRLSQLLDHPHHEKSIAGSTRRRYGKQILIVPDYIDARSMQKVAV
jgi:hypothetical protein